MPRPPRGRRRGHGAVEDPRHGFSEEEWHDMVSTAAYYRARARGFENGSADEDWFEAEAELRTRFGAAESDVEGGPNPGDGATGIETKGE
ncbi:MAG TPA: DUF2934 domain-containing protein [Burkholderiales bacterium]|nr:DUF2934 domain-containing protein [Burkholderiales bacterium]